MNSVSRPDPISVFSNYILNCQPEQILLNSVTVKASRQTQLSFRRPSSFTEWHSTTCHRAVEKMRLKCDGTRAETRFRLSAKRRVHLNRPVGVSSVNYWQPRCAPSAVVMLDTPCSEVVWRVLANHSIRQFPLHFSTRASPCAITHRLDSNFSHEASLRPHAPTIWSSLFSPP